MFNLEHKTVQTRGKNHVVNHYTGVKEYLYMCCCISSILLLYLYFAQVWPPLAALPSRPLGRDGSTNLSAFQPAPMPSSSSTVPVSFLSMTNGRTPKHSQPQRRPKASFLYLTAAIISFPRDLEPKIQIQIEIQLQIQI